MNKSYLDQNEVAQLEEAATNLRDRLLIRLLFRLGCRISEVLEITTDDIDFKQSTVTVKQTKTKIILLCPDCNSKLNKNSKFCPKCGIEITKAVKQEKEQCTCRRIPLDKASFSILKKFIDGNGPVNNNGKLYLFVINRHRAWQIIKECAEKAGCRSW
jgi:integrase/recombinase XerD